MSVRLHIPDRHDTDKISWDITLPDYHPLSFEDIVELLTLAQTSPEKRLDIHLRMVQGIQGQVSPHEIEGTIATIQPLVEELIVNRFDPRLIFQDIPILVFAAMLYPLLHWQDTADQQAAIGKLTAERDAYRAALETIAKFTPENQPDYFHHDFPFTAAMIMNGTAEKALAAFKKAEGE